MHPFFNDISLKEGQKNNKNNKCIPNDLEILDKICYGDGVQQKNDGCYEDIKALSKIVCRTDMYYDNVKKKCVEKSFHPPGVDQILLIGAFYAGSKIYSTMKKE